ncbi:MAG: helix-turn-helix domain-containing protein [Flavipsychrobacter sp.]
MKSKLRYEDKEQVLKAIGNKMKTLRKQKGYKNYETFAYENEIPRAQYGRYERGSDLKLTNFLKVLDALDISLHEFFDKDFD